MKTLFERNMNEDNTAGQLDMFTPSPTWLRDEDKGIGDFAERPNITDWIYNKYGIYSLRGDNNIEVMLTLNFNTDRNKVPGASTPYSIYIIILIWDYDVGLALPDEARIDLNICTHVRYDTQKNQEEDIKKILRLVSNGINLPSDLIAKIKSEIEDKLREVK